MQPSNQYFQPQVPAGPPGQAPGPMRPVMPPAPQTGYNDAHKGRTKMLIVIGLLSLSLVFALVFAFWAFANMQDYKNNSDQKVAAAVAEAVRVNTEENTAAFAVEQKKDRKTYTGPSSYGTITVEYPKIWSGYIDNDENSNEPVNAMFHPDVVPAVTGSGKDKPAVALTIQVVNKAYDDVVEESKRYGEEGSSSAVPFALEKLPSIVGMKITGKISQEFNGTKVILPLRDKTITITAETDQFAQDLETYILPYISFIP